MSIVKITNLPALTTIASNTSNTLFLGVDLATSTTGKFTATTLAQQLYANNYLRVGDYGDVYPNSVATMAGYSNNYVQTILENTSNTGTSDIVVFGSIDDFLLTSMTSQAGSLSFINEGSTKRKEILGKFLDLEHFDKKFKLAKDESAYVKANLKRLENKNFDDEIKTIKESIEQNQKTVKETETAIEQTKSSISELTKETQLTS